MRKNFCIVEKLPSIQSRIDVPIIVMLTTGGKNENSNKFKNPGPEKCDLIH